jgi:hypothetical protein
MLMKLLKLALEQRRFDLAAHVLVYGLVKAHQQGQEGRNGHGSYGEGPKKANRQRLLQSRPR